MITKEQMLEALNDIVDNRLLTEGNYFICIVLREYCVKKFFNWQPARFPMFVAEELMSKYKPRKFEFSEFIDEEFWVGTLAWWAISDEEGCVDKILDSKYRYLKQLIQVIEFEGKLRYSR